MKAINFNLINCFEDFTDSLHIAGMTAGGESSEGVFSLASYFGEGVEWHTQEKNTDPWEWRMRVLNERDDIAYAKLFFKKSGYITKEWYPYFYSVRRGSKSFEEEYSDGLISADAKKIYQLIKDNGSLPLHMIKELGGFTKEDKYRFDQALTQLQMRMYVTMCGNNRKRSKSGEEYGWSSTVFCTTESFFRPKVFDMAEKLSPKEAYEEIEEHILRLNPTANRKKIMKFIMG